MPVLLPPGMRRARSPSPPPPRHCAWERGARAVPRDARGARVGARRRAWAIDAGRKERRGGGSGLERRLNQAAAAGESESAKQPRRARSRTKPPLPPAAPPRPAPAAAAPPRSHVGQQPPGAGRGLAAAPRPSLGGSGPGPLGEAAAEA